MARGRVRERVNAPAPAEQPPVQQATVALVIALQQRLVAQETEMEELRNKLQQRRGGSEQMTILPVAVPTPKPPIVALISSDLCKRFRHANA